MRIQKNAKTPLLRSQSRGRRRGRSVLYRKRTHARGCCARKTVAKPLRRCTKVSDKLEALKNLIPSSHAGEISKPDQLFKETADYILLLRTQVVILQKLIEFYGSSEKQNSVSS